MDFCPKCGFQGNTTPQCSYCGWPISPTHEITEPRFQWSILGVYFRDQTHQYFPPYFKGIMDALDSFLVNRVAPNWTIWHRDLPPTEVDEVKLLHGIWSEFLEILGVLDSGFGTLEMVFQSMGNPRIVFCPKCEITDVDQIIEPDASIMMSWTAQNPGYLSQLSDQKNMQVPAKLYQCNECQSLFA